LIFSSLILHFIKRLRANRSFIVNSAPLIFLSKAFVCSNGGHFRLIGKNNVNAHIKAHV